MVILSQIIDGDKAAFQEFYEHWNKRLYAFFYKKVGDAFAAEELTQLTFIKCWEYRSSFSLAYTLEVQLFQKAKLVFIDWLRKEATRRKLSAAGFEYLRNDNEDCSSVERQLEKLHQAIDGLPAMRKKVIKLSHIDGHRYKAIASQLKISPKTVDNHIYQAIKQLRKMLGLFL